jgi:hypothetical protein
MISNLKTNGQKRKPSWRYCKKLRAGSVAHGFAQYEDSLPLPPNIDQLNHIRYQAFCRARYEISDPTSLNGYHVGVYR